MLELADMTELQIENLIALRSALPDEPLRLALPGTMGGYSTANGFWRFFSNKYPAPGGILAWNSDNLWRQAWTGLTVELFFWGEDIFGNQLALVPGRSNAFIWNHENGELIDLLLAPDILVETVLQSGIDWIDFYNPDILAIGRAKVLDIPENCHLHWTQPLILGGAAA